MLIVEVNKNIKPLPGIQNKIHISDVSVIIEGSDPPLMTVPVPVPDDCDIKIAQNIAELVEDESTLQLGIGSLPTAVGKSLAESDISEIYCHTEVMADPYVDMFESGKLKGNKYADDGKILYGSVIGTKRVYDFVEKNELCCCAPIEYINDFGVVSAIDRFVSVNGCLSVDMFGQVNSESVGFQHVSGTGGQLDFALAAYASKGGKSFLCLHSTRSLKDGSRISNLVPYFAPGTIITTPRAAVHYIVTEYGAVCLKGRSTFERAEALVSIAHPDFREQLIAEAEKMGVWKNTSKIS
jgi:acyl-CoA hydrolase